MKSNLDSFSHANTKPAYPYPINDYQLTNKHIVITDRQISLEFYMENHLAI